MALNNCAYRVGLALCGDGIAPFNGKHAGNLTLEPVCLVVLAFPPAIRHRPDYIILSMLMPHSAGTKFEAYLVRMHARKGACIWAVGCLSSSPCPPPC